MIPRAFDRDELRDRFQSATPFPHMMIDDFLEDDDVRGVAAAYPSFAEADEIGQQFKALNEMRKIQVTDSAHFAPPVAALNDMLASPEFISDLEHITGIQNLLPDPKLAGGGIHMTGARGRLDVHVDFDYLEKEQLHRRLNLLVYLNPVWEDNWGGGVEVWDQKVEQRHGSFAPKLNRVVMFATSTISFHGVEEVRCPEGTTRNSFAVYYYTKEAPPTWKGKPHTTIFKARPDERLNKYVLMPAKKAADAARDGRRKAREAKNKLKHLLKG